MARPVVYGRNFSPFAPVEELGLFQECVCSIFLPGSHDGIPQYIASSYLNGSIRLHDSSALTLSETDGISASHFCSFMHSDEPTIQLKAMPTEREMLLLCLDESGKLVAMRLGDVLYQRDDSASCVQMETRFFLEKNTPTRTTCFTVDNTNKRIFTGCNGGMLFSHDLRLGTNRLSPAGSYQAHRSSILDLDYCQGLLASASQDGAVCVWDVRSRSCVVAFDPATGKHLSLSEKKRAEDSGRDHSLRVRFDETGRHVVASTRRKHITVWNVRSDSAQCTLCTDCIPYALDTAKNSIFFSGGVDSVWRYSMYDAQMQCYPTSTSGINHMLIDPELQQTMVISGAADTVELLSLEGLSLGKATGKKETNELGLTNHQLPPTSSMLDVDSPSYPSIRPVLASPIYTCESGSEMLTDEEGDLFDDDEGSSVYDYSPANDAISFSTGDDMLSDNECDELVNDGTQLETMEMDAEPLEAYGFTSDSDISPPYDYVVPLIPESNNCDFSSSQSDEILSDEEDEE